MVALASVRTGAIVLGIAVFPMADAGAQSSQPARNASDAGYVEGTIRISVTRARQIAIQKLRSPRCRKLFEDFRDLPGRRLDEVLDALGESSFEHLLRIEFRSGAPDETCARSGVYAFTSLGGSAVFVCPAFLLLTRQEPKAAANVLIHEELHSLGAGEAPMPGLPTAREISKRVEERCGQ
jgi:hypothetical protein